MQETQVDVLAAFDTGASYPRPIRFKVYENGIKKTVDVSEILNVEDLGAGGMMRYEYTCRSQGARGPIEYRLKYYYMKSNWTLER